MPASKRHILEEIRRIAAENGGSTPGLKTFVRESGIPATRFLGVHWIKWSDAVTEAGFTPNEPCSAHSEEFLLVRLSQMIRKLGHFPSRYELRFHCSRQPGFPSVWAFARLGNKRELIAKVRDFCADRPSHQDVAAVCAQLLETAATQPSGFVYLFRAGRRHKIGLSNSPERRRRELASNLPQELEILHVIETDDPIGIEAYWHDRFADKRIKGEWFKLNTADVAIFKKRKFM